MTTAPLGLTSAEARERLLRFGARRLQPSRETAAFALFFRQLTSPIILILIGAALLSMFLADVSDALMILFIVLASACLSFWQEFQASNAVEKLRAIVMIVFGTLSSVFDYLTFAALLSLGATQTAFRTGWFIESIASASLVVLVVRSRRAFFQSRPSKLLMIATGATIVITFTIPHLPLASALGFAPMPAHFYPIVIAIVLAYMASAEVMKRFFYRLVRHA